MKSSVARALASTGVGIYRFEFLHARERVENLEACTIRRQTSPPYKHRASLCSTATGSGLLRARRQLRRPGAMPRCGRQACRSNPAAHHGLRTESRDLPRARSSIESLLCCHMLVRCFLVLTSVGQKGLIEIFEVLFDFFNGEMIGGLECSHGGA